MTSPRHYVSVAAAVTDDDGRVLVIRRRDNGKWQPPGGVLELDEAIEQGVRREVREETGVDIEPIRLTGIYKNMHRAVVALVFLARPVSGQPHPTDEADTVEWWTPDQVAQHMDEAFAVRILDALRHDYAPAIRSHDGVRLISSDC
jgi:8-oxo-dGTP diphosphatase